MVRYVGVGCGGDLGVGEWGVSDTSAAARSPRSVSAACLSLLVLYYCFTSALLVLYYFFTTGVCLIRQLLLDRLDPSVPPACLYYCFTSALLVLY